MVPLFDVTVQTGGLEVVPRSHAAEAKINLKERCPNLAAAGDWCPGLSRLYPMWGANKPRLVTARAGDLVLWDSRTVHGGRVGKGMKGVGKGVKGVRAVDSCNSSPLDWIPSESEKKLQGTNDEDEESSTATDADDVRAAKGVRSADAVAKNAAVTVTGDGDGGIVGAAETVNTTETSEAVNAVETVEAAGTSEAVALARLSVTVCMTPRAWASERVLEIRRNAFAKGKILTHWPHEAPGTGANSARAAANGHVPIVLTEEQRALL
jgi:hypothetical protein